MVEHDLFGVQDRPEYVIQNEFPLGLVFAHRGDLSHELLGLFGGRLAGEAANLDLFDYLLGSFVLGNHALDETTLLDLQGHGRTVEEVERL